MREVAPWGGGPDSGSSIQLRYSPKPMPWDEPASPQFWRSTLKNPPYNVNSFAPRLLAVAIACAYRCSTGAGG